MKVKDYTIVKLLMQAFINSPQSESHMQKKAEGGT